MRKGDWYLTGFRPMGFKYWIMSIIIRVFYKLRLIGDEDAKRYADMLFNAYMMESCKNHGLKVKHVELRS